MSWLIMVMLGLASAGEDRVVEKATMELKPSQSAQSAAASLAKAVVKHTPYVNNRNITAAH